MTHPAWTLTVLLALALAGCTGSPEATDDTQGNAAVDRCADPSTATLVGTEGPDELDGTDDADIIFGLGGDDIIRAHSGDDIVCGGPGNDQLGGGPGYDVIDGGEGEDSCKGGPDDNDIVNCESG